MRSSGLDTCITEEVRWIRQRDLFTLGLALVELCSGITLTVMMIPEDMDLSELVSGGDSGHGMLSKSM